MWYLDIRFAASDFAREVPQSLHDALTLPDDFQDAERCLFVGGHDADHRGQAHQIPNNVFAVQARLQCRQPQIACEGLKAKSARVVLGVIKYLIFGFGISFYYLAI